MKFIKRLIFFLGFLILLILLLAMFVSKDFSVTKEIVINKPVPEVYSYLKLLKNQDNFSVWNQMDPNMKKTYSGTDGTPGFVSSWESENDQVGKGAQEIKSLEENKRVEFEIRFEKPMKATNYARFTTTAVGENQTKVSWTFFGKSPYPMNIMNLFMDKMVSGDFEKGLSNLKTVMEK